MTPAVDWVAVLGPGGIIALLIVIDRIVTKWRAGHAERQQTVVSSWREIASETRTLVKAQQTELSAKDDEVEYWRARAGHAEYLLRLHNIEVSLPASIRRRRPPPPPAINP